MWKKTRPVPKRIFRLTNRMGALFVLKGDLATMKYRAEYGYSGQEVGKATSLTATDQVGGKFVWEWKLPHVIPKMEFSRFANNVEEDPTRSQTIGTQQQFSPTFSGGELFPHSYPNRSMC